MPVIRRRSPYSGRFHEREVNINIPKFDVWLEAKRENLDGLPNFEEMFPVIHQHDRDFLISGVTPEETELTKLASFSDRSILIPIEAHEELCELQTYGIEQASYHLKVPGAVGFRTEDGFSSPQIYVDDIMAGARIAAQFRFHCMYVYVVSADDEISHVWEAGVPSGDDPITIALANEFPADKFEIGDENVSEIVKKWEDLAANLETMFEIAVGPPTKLWEELSQEFELQARGMYEASHTFEQAKRSICIASLMLSTDLLFCKMHIELTANAMLIHQFGRAVTFTTFEEKLAAVEEKWLERDHNRSDLARNLVQKILLNHNMDPLYVDKIKSEKVADKLACIQGDKLPVVYIWGEKKVSTGVTYSFSINGYIFGKELENFLSKRDPSFGLIRDKAMEKIRQIVGPAIFESLQKTGLPPSLGFKRLKLKRRKIRF